LITCARPRDQRELGKAKSDIPELNRLHDEVTKFKANHVNRRLGSVLHAEPIVDSVGPTGALKYIRDWALVKVGKNILDWSKFLGNKVYIGTLSSLRESWTKNPDLLLFFFLS